MIKKFFCVVVLVCVASSLFALDFSKAKPFSEEEFPKIVVDLRRAEKIFFGGIPIVYPVASLALETFGANLNFWQTMAITCSVTAVIALADYIIGVVQN